MPAACKPIINLSRDNVVCERAVIADRAIRRMRGLLGRPSLPLGEGILLTPAPSIHTAFMRFPIDVVFADRLMKVVKISADLGPFHTAASRHARYALELPAGEAARRGIEVGDQLAVGVAIEPGVPPAITEPDLPPAITEPGDLVAVTPIAGALELNDGEAVAPNGLRRLAELEQLRGSTAAICVLLVGDDRRFRSVATALLERRGLIVAAEERRALRFPAALLAADVIVLDAGSSLTVAAQDAAALSTALPDAGIVIVADRQVDDLSSMRVTAKWGPVDDLVGAIEDAHRDCSARRSAAAEDVSG